MVETVAGIIELPVKLIESNEFKSLDAYEKLVLIHIHQHNGRIHTVRAIAKLTGMSKSKVATSLKRLRQLRMI